MTLSRNLRAGVALLSSLSLLAACAQTREPIVDVEGEDRAAGKADVAECRDRGEHDAAMRRAFAAHTGREWNPWPIPAEPDPANQKAFALFLIGGLFTAALGAGLGAATGSLVGASVSEALQGAAASGAAQGAALGAAQGAALGGTAAVVAAGASGVPGKAEITKDCAPEPGSSQH